MRIFTHFILHLRYRVTMYILWIGVSFILIFGGRFLRVVSLTWFYIHTVIGIVMLALSLYYGLAVGSESRSKEVGEGNSHDAEGSGINSFHKGVGFAVYILTLVLIVDGFLLRAQRRIGIMPRWMNMNQAFHSVTFEWNQLY